MWEVTFHPRAPSGLSPAPCGDLGVGVARAQAPCPWALSQGQMWRACAPGLWSVVQTPVPAGLPCGRRPDTLGRGMLGQPGPQRERKRGHLGFSLHGAKEVAGAPTLSPSFLFLLGALTVATWTPLRAGCARPSGHLRGGFPQLLRGGQGPGGPPF